MTRIIAGRAGGRRLRTPDGDSTRPTSDRVREAFFSSLAAWNGTSDQPADTQLEGQSVLDLFAGSGAVGLEAASRGAARVVAVEKNPRTAALIRTNARTCGLADRLTAVAAGAERYLAGGLQADPFDVIWFDPPYATGADQLDALIAEAVGAFLAPDGLIAVERSARGRAPVMPEGLDSWTNRYGETVVHLAQPTREHS
ncbi:16S rRNA (guanine(966)-N(2))-methyltransferase RsmD [Acidipropionibacterium jensenii]|uniref:16S rRNA (Guanine(966)-N(2))-methyltransferase RsmD n=1 Tax=Acidipropionibacterium jensenii TaxID=1749 RepID=A0A3Q9UIM0_9ACTN|nr:16S rRNA (guanine(966)-N(2))-methyltransferase RsmD [Acidipropionibacterium jensenii]AZZ42426.1 16S rRNA (guanine(966)-N(2))-methyltransferase RsmD [Acidipropionibacterium jensenii]